MKLLVLDRDNKVFHYKGVELGDIVCGDDGFYTFWFNTSRTGGWTQEVLLELSELLKEKNHPMEQDLENYFNGTSS